MAVFFGAMHMGDIALGKRMGDDVPRGSKQFKPTTPRTDLLNRRGFGRHTFQLRMVLSSCDPMLSKGANMFSCRLTDQVDAPEH